jgi:ATP-dependent Clp protease ATP-binding subunit ClpA
MDEAASKIRMEINSKPEELDVLRQKSNATRNRN